MGYAVVVQAIETGERGCGREIGCAFVRWGVVLRDEVCLCETGCGVVGKVLARSRSRITHPSEKAAPPKKAGRCPPPFLLRSLPRFLALVSPCSLFRLLLL
eukprot:2356057-Rhodomonas_salina.2